MAKPVAWMISLDDSQYPVDDLDDAQAVDDLTNHNAVAIPLYTIPSDMVLVPKETLRLWHRVTAQTCGASDEWGREMQDQMWALLAAAEEK